MFFGFGFGLYSPDTEDLGIKSISSYWLPTLPMFHFQLSDYSYLKVDLATAML